MMFDQLNTILSNFVNEEKIYFEDFILIDRFVDIILNHHINLNRPKYYSKMGLFKSIDYSYQFLNSIDKKYGYLLHHILKDDIITFIKRSTSDVKLSNVTLIDGKKHIDIFENGNIEDSYTLTHELFHYSNMPLNNITSNWHLMTEAISITSELLQKQFFANKDIKFRDYYNNEIDTLIALKIKAYQLDFELGLIYTYMRYGYIDSYLYSELFKDKSEFYANVVTNDILDVLYHNKLNYELLQRNIIGGVLSSHMYSRINNNRKYLQEFIEINDNCNQMTFIETLKYLNLDVIDDYFVILSDDSFKLLDNEYQQRVKKIYN